MLNILTADKIYLYPGYTDMRLGIFGLIKMIFNPEKDSAYVFCNKNKTVIKVLFYNKTSATLCQKRLFKGSFVWPKVNDKTLIDESILEYLLDSADVINQVELSGKEINFGFF